MSYSPKTWALGDPITPTDLSRIENGVASADAKAEPPTGMLAPFAGSLAPDGWALCYGQAVDRVGTYAALFAVIGTTYNTGGELATQFRLPDMRGNIPLGLDNMGGTPRNRITATQADSLGGEAGTETHALTSAQLAAHTHTIAHTHNSYYYRAGGTGASSYSTNMPHQSSYSVSTPTSASSASDSGSTGSGTAHPNTQPYMALNYIIKT